MKLPRTFSARFCNIVSAIAVWPVLLWLIGIGAKKRWLLLLVDAGSFTVALLIEQMVHFALLHWSYYLVEYNVRYCSQCRCQMLHCCIVDQSRCWMLHCFTVAVCCHLSDSASEGITHLLLATSSLDKCTFPTFLFKAFGISRKKYILCSLEWWLGCQ